MYIPKYMVKMYKAKYYHQLYGENLLKKSFKKIYFVKFKKQSITANYLDIYITKY